MRTRLVVGNWKMNCTLRESTALVESLMHYVDTRADVDVAICPSFVSMAKVRDLLRNSHIKLGAQDAFWDNFGAFTGQVSAAMLYDVGVTYCIVGHSERRGRFGKLEVPRSTLGYFGDTNETVNLKLKSLLYYSINPILCVGETLSEREEGQTDAVIEAQIRGALAGFDAAELAFLSVAYEPVWAIGTGHACDPDEADRVCGMIRNLVAESTEDWLADDVRVLYGGSVKRENAGEFFRRPNIDGGLVGGASLDAKDFSLIVLGA
ncbi:MAG: triose-phosphate isomerase [Fimbriimonadaceae bacterium]